MIKVTSVPTGKAWLKSAQKCGGEGRNAFQRKLDIFRDKNWVGPLEIFAWLIEHPEGKFLVDTGDTAENSTPGYLPWWNPFFTKEVSIRVAPHEEIGPRLRTSFRKPQALTLSSLAWRNRQRPARIGRLCMVSDKVGFLVGNCMGAMPDFALCDLWELRIGDFVPQLLSVAAWMSVMRSGRLRAW